VDWELPDVGRLGERAIAELCDGWHEPALSELVEGVAGVPEVEYAPAAVDRTGRVEDQPVGWPALDVEVVVNRDVLLLGSPGNLSLRPMAIADPFVEDVGRA
jgi:hypothetical protein